MRKSALILLAVLLVAGPAVAAAAWSPWLPQQEAERRAVDAFAAWQGAVDGCGLNCEGCGARGSRRFAGYSVVLEYGCGVQSFQNPEPNRTEVVYVSPLGTVHGLRRP